MIYLHTGQPGAGKTLLTLDIIRKRAKAENRPVYYAGIQIEKPEMFPGWIEMDDAKKWMECPDGSIIVHDECQTLYRPRGNGSAVPEYVARFETHRHNGWDIYLITQHPMLVDSNIRRLAGEHVHVVRAFGSKMATLHKWGQVKEQCDKARSDSIQETRSYPADLFGAYKSATVHTHKLKIPPRVFFLVALPLILGAIVWWFFGWYSEKSQGPKLESVTMKAAPGASAAGAGAARKDPEDWFRDRVPRVPGLPHTAPVYDKAVEVVRAPYPAACVASASRCRCYTDQGTRMQTTEELCRQIAETGYFVSWRTERDDAARAAAMPTVAPHQPGV